MLSTLLTSARPLLTSATPPLFLCCVHLVTFYCFNMSLCHLSLTSLTFKTAAHPTPHSGAPIRNPVHGVFICTAPPPAWIRLQPPGVIRALQRSEEGRGRPNLRDTGIGSNRPHALGSVPGCQCWQKQGPETSLECSLGAVPALPH